MSERVTHYLKVYLLEPEADGYDPEALKRFVADDAPQFHDQYAEEWGIDPDETWSGPEASGCFTLQFIAAGNMQSVAEEISAAHPSVYVDLLYWDDESAGVVELVAGDVWEETHVEDLEEGRELSEWHRGELEWLDD